MARVLLPKQEDLSGAVLTRNLSLDRLQSNVEDIEGRLQGVEAGTTPVGAIAALDASLDITGLAAAQGGAILATGGTSATAANAGGAVGLAGGLPGATGVGGAVNLTGAIGGATSGEGGAVVAAGGAGTAGNAAGGLVSATGGAGQGSAAGGAVTLLAGAGGATGAGGAASLKGGRGGATSGAAGTAIVTGGAGGATPATTTGGVARLIAGGSGAGATGNGGAAEVTGGAALSTDGSGGAAIVTGGALAGTGVNGGVHLRSPTGLIFDQQTAATTGIADGNWAPTVAQFINGILSGDVTTGRTLTTPTGAQLSTACGIGLAVGDAFNVYVSLIGSAGADDILTMTAGDGNVTFIGTLTVGPIVAGTAPGAATWRFRNTGANTWVGYRIA